MLPPTKKKSLVDIVNDRIKTYIADHQLKPGDKLPSAKELNDMLSVSRSVVRESLISLQSLGIVQIKPGGGISVGEMSLGTVMDQIPFLWKSNSTVMKELLDSRIILELGAIELAIAHYDVALIERMNDWNRQLEWKISLNEQPGEEDVRFHLALFQATGNKLYIRFGDLVRDYFDKGQLDKINLPDALRSACKEHDEIVYWIKERDVEKAKACMRNHLEPLYRLL
ncbi:FadR/GntR family transcriptional regulator [Paenibacillus oceani]|uniref:FadR family transcriptional regulator n=1 Tax=Paenibacillus oceani TaxID=2772510 RepID=A0A927CDI8_9BACL|nr:FadR/GntR family transcriptional regulator [Paenibacillus oceani]MBD2866083.1 FadR family transcriptional regulator [Paenibacillus oceani]